MEEGKKNNIMTKKQAAITQHAPHRSHVEILVGPEDGWLTVSEATRASKRPGGTIRRWIREGKLPISTSSPGPLQIRLSDLEKLTKIVEPYSPSKELKQNKQGRKVQQHLTADSQEKQPDMPTAQAPYQNAEGKAISAIPGSPVSIDQIPQLLSCFQTLMAKQEQLLTVQQQNCEVVQTQLSQATDILKHHLLRQQEMMKTNQIELLTQQKFQRELLQEISDMMGTVLERLSTFASVLDHALNEVKEILQEHYHEMHTDNHK